MSKGNTASKFAAVLLTLVLTVPLFVTMVGARPPTDSSPDPAVSPPPGPQAETTFIPTAEASYDRDLAGTWTSYDEAATFYLRLKDHSNVGRGEGALRGEYKNTGTPQPGILNDPATIADINPGRLEPDVLRNWQDGNTYREHSETHVLYAHTEDTDLSDPVLDFFGDPPVPGDATFLWHHPANFDMFLDMESPPVLDLYAVSTYPTALEVDLIAVKPGQQAAAEAALDAGDLLDPSLYRTVLRSALSIDDTTNQGIIGGAVQIGYTADNIYLPQPIGWIDGGGYDRLFGTMTQVKNAASDENPGTFDTYSFCRSAMGLHSNEEKVCILEGETLGLIVHARQPCFIDAIVLCAVENDNNQDPDRYVFMRFGGGGGGSANYPSSVRLIADSARVNAWTENRAGTVVDEFPTSDQVPKEDREVGVHILHANGWGETFITPRTAGNGVSIGYSGADYDFRRPDDHPSLGKFVRDEILAEFVEQGQRLDAASPVGPDRWIVMSDPFGTSDDDRDKHDADPNNGIQMGEWTRFYPETVDASVFHDYNPALSVYSDVDANNRMEVVPGVYRTIIESPKGWTQDIDFDIGGHDFEFGLAPGEFAAHSVRSGQATKFQLQITNTGGQSDEYLIGPSNLPGGWTASMSTSTVQAGPGNTQTVAVTVTPPGNAVPGDSRQITLSAVSKETGVIKTTTLTVLLVAIDRPLDAAGNERLPSLQVTSLLNAVETRANHRELIPIVVQNLGHIASKFHVSASGAPVGWGVQVSPSTLTALGQSQEAFTVTLDVPSDAAPGTSFALQLKAIRIDNALDFGTLNLPVTVFTRDAMAVGLFDGSGAASRHTLHLRDEGVNSDEDDLGNPTPDFRKIAQADQDFDQTAVHRVMVTNTGDRADTFTLKALWDSSFHNGWGFDDETEYGLNGELSGDNSIDDDRRCDGRYNPDGWRFTWTPTGDPKLMNREGVFSQAYPYQFTTITLAPGETGYLPLEIGWTEDFEGANRQSRGSSGWQISENCPSSAYQNKGDNFQGFEYCNTEGTAILQSEVLGENVDPSQASSEDQAKYVANRPFDQVTEARMQIQVTSANDPSLFETLNAGVRMDRIDNLHVLGARNVYPEASHGVHLGIESGKTASGSVEKGKNIDFQMRARNLGNEMDTLRMLVPGTLQGWTFRIISIDAGTNIQPNLDSGQMGKSLLDFQGFGCGSSTSRESSTHSFTPAPGPKLLAPGSGLNAAACGALPAVSLQCVMGSGDEVVFTVRATAPANAVIGDNIRAPVTVTSLDDTTKVDSEFISAVVTGQRAFRILAEKDVVSTKPDVTVAIPYTIDNFGLADDTYELTLFDAPDDWAVAFSGGSKIFVPGQRQGHGFVTVTPPSNVANGDAEDFEVKFRSVANSAVKDMEFTVVIDDSLNPAGFAMGGNPREVVAVKPSFSLPPEADLNVVATLLPTDAGDTVTFTIDRCAMPHDWAIGDPTAASPEGVRSCADAKAVDDDDPDTVDPIEELLVLSALVDSSGQAALDLVVRGVDGDIGTSRVAIRVDGVHGDAKAFVDMIVNRASTTSGVELIDPSDDGSTDFAHLIVSGGNIGVPLHVRNLGLGADTVELTVDEKEPGWTVTFDKNTVPLQPLQTADVFATVTAPEGLPPGDETPLRLRATSQADPSQSGLLDLVFVTGESVIEMAHELPSTFEVAPFEEVTYRIGLVNNGTVPDTFDLNVALSPAFTNLVDVKLEPKQVVLNPGDGTAATIKVSLSDDIVPSVRVPLKLEARSGGLGNIQTTSGSLAFSATMLPYIATDVDLDGVDEYAVNRDKVSANGFEQFWEPNTDGIDAQTVNMASFLSTEAKGRFTQFVPQGDGTVKSTSTFRFDLDQDGRAEFAIDLDQDGLADLWWNQQIDVIDELTVQKDVTKDGVPEWFVDLDADSLLDICYDIVEGKICKLLRFDIDGDGHVDYVVDLNNNGQADEAEPILFSVDGKVKSIQEKVDVTGDGNPDLVLDDDGDGIPDRFVPHGHTRSVKLTLEDIDGDGIAEWTYDGNGDGSRDRFYDPVTGETGRIDTESEFIDAVREYWYVGALFGVVLILFVVLLAVTRR